MTWTVEQKRQYNNERYARQRDLFYRILGGVCVECGSNSELQIDHVDRNQKSFNIGRLWPESKLHLAIEELKKCQLLCFDCHVEKSTIELQGERGWRHGTLYGYQKKGCRCSPCRDARRKSR